MELFKKAAPYLYYFYDSANEMIIYRRNPDESGEDYRY